MQPCPSSRGTATKKKKKREKINKSVCFTTRNEECGNGPLTSVESASNSHADDGECEETGHRHQNLAALVVNGVDTDDMDGGAGRDEDGSADRLEQEEMGTLLNLKGEQGIDETLARIIDLKMEN